MRILYSVIGTLALLTISFTSVAQIDFLSFTKPGPNYRECAAVFFNDLYIVDDIAPKGSCELFPNMVGELSVASVSFSEEGAKPLENIKFQVAIKNYRTNTLWILTKEPVSKIYLQDIIDKCEMGDKVIIMPVDQKYSLSHHEIDLNFGC